MYAYLLPEENRACQFQDQTSYTQNQRSEGKTRIRLTKFCKSTHAFSFKSTILAEKTKEASDFKSARVASIKKNFEK